MVVKPANPRRRSANHYSAVITLLDGAYSSCVTAQLALQFRILLGVRIQQVA